MGSLERMSEGMYGRMEPARTAVTAVIGTESAAVTEDDRLTGTLIF
jgi:hypothetical protein